MAAEECSGAATMADYPGSAVHPSDVIALADEYRTAALHLLSKGQKGKPLTRTPARLCAVHAIELYLNAYLLARGLRSEAVRAMFHDLHLKTGESVALGLCLRRRTVAHLEKLTQSREYLVVRYAPTELLSLTEVNRVFATLDEIARKVRAAL